MIDTPSHAALPRPWGNHDLSEGHPLPVRIGPRDLWLQRQDGEVWLATAEVPFGTDPAEATIGTPTRTPPAALAWSRWATAGDESGVVLRPEFPDRAFVLEPERPFRLLPQAQARVYVRIPLWIRVELPLSDGGETSAILDEIPLLPLSDTWWGDDTEGELAYWLPTTARREVTREIFVPHMAVCPLVMSNRSSVSLRVEKLAFRVAHLSLFADGERLWADESKVTYRGDGEGSEVEMTGRPPKEASGGRLVTAPRAPVQRGMRARTFERIAALPGLGGMG